MLACPVRHCGERLPDAGRTRRCAKGHSFDEARSGYLNLLQPQDSRSRQPGDSAEVAAARRRLHDRGTSAEVLRAAGAMLRLRETDVLLEAGCGDGFYAGQLSLESHCQAWGVDISAASLDAAARRYRHCRWIVANADRRLPFADGVFSAVVTVAARLQPREFRRVLQAGGRLLVGVPSAEDLQEIRGTGRDRSGRVLEECGADFRLEEQRRATARMALDAEGIEDVRLAIYRPMQAEAAVATTVTFSVDLLLFTGR
jgi:23S rRNA (guanine745-N1)-methyltransferase